MPKKLYQTPNQATFAGTGCGAEVLVHGMETRSIAKVVGRMAIISESLICPPPIVSAVFVETATSCTGHIRFLRAQRFEAPVAVERALERFERGGTFWRR